MPTAQALIIDDNVTNILVLQQLLMMEDVAAIAISTTKNLQSQLDAITHVDLVFLDLEMPVLSGYEAVGLIKTHQNFQDTPVVAYSVHVSEVNNVRHLGFDGFLGKPISAEAFPDQLARILRGEEVYYLP